MSQRVDPYWGPMWGGRAAASYEDWKEARRIAQADGRPMRERDRRHTPKEARLLLADQGHALFTRRLQCLAPIAAYGVLTNQQIAAFVGAPEIARHADDLDLAFSAGLVKRGWPTAASRRRNSRHPVDLYIPNNDRAVKQVFERHFYAAVRAGVTENYRWNSASIHARHDLLAAEIALRIAETDGPSIDLVLGETDARLTDIAAVRRPEVAEAAGDRRGDVLMFRNDQLPIVVELTANVGKDYRDKLAVYADMIGNYSAHDDGFAVLFLEAAHPAVSKTIANTARRNLRQVATEHGDSPWGTRVASRMFFGRWQDWFPRHERVHPDKFLKLQVQRIDNNRWRTVDLADHRQVPFSPNDDGFELADRIERRHASWAIPYWQGDNAGHHHAAALAAARFQTALAQQL